MPASFTRVFLALAGLQALHSLEEYRNELWDHLLPARFLSSLLADDLATGFAAFNLLLVVLLLASWQVLVRRPGRLARALAWFWATLETLNGLGHIVFAMLAGGYFPGVYTAPLLLAVGGYLLLRLVRGEGGGRG